MEFYELEPLIEHLHLSEFLPASRSQRRELTRLARSSRVPGKPFRHWDEEGSHLHVRLERLPSTREEPDEQVCAAQSLAIAHGREAVQLSSTGCVLPSLLPCAEPN